MTLLTLTARSLLMQAEGKPVEIQALYIALGECIDTRSYMKWPDIVSELLAYQQSVEARNTDEEKAIAAFDVVKMLTERFRNTTSLEQNELTKIGVLRLVNSYAMAWDKLNIATKDQTIALVSNLGLYQPDPQNWEWAALVDPEVKTFYELMLLVYKQFGL